jgi:hypothetical protein
VDGWMHRVYHEEHYSPTTLFTGEMVGLVANKDFPSIFQPQNTSIFETEKPFEVYFKSQSDEVSLI